jgi:hypothetical protein
MGDLMLRKTGRMRAAVLGAMLLVGGSATAVPAVASETVQAQARSETTVLADVPTSDVTARNDLMVARAYGARNPKITTAGGEAELTIEWNRRGPGKFDTRVYGTVKDTAEDNHCARVDIWADGMSRPITQDGACPKGDIELVKGQERAWRVLVRVCAESCSGWS